MGDTKSVGKGLLVLEQPLTFTELELDLAAIIMLGKGLKNLGGTLDSLDKNGRF